MQSAISRANVRRQLIATNVSKSFGHLSVLQGIMLDVSPNEVLGVVGPSGCGKTTLLNILAGHLAPETGSITVDGERVVSPTPRQLLVTQIDGLLPNRTVINNLLFPAEVGLLEAAGLQKLFLAMALAFPPWRNLSLRRLANDKLRAADALLTQFHLADFRSLYPRQLSAGMRKRIELLRAMLVSPQYLLLDEPFAHLDPLTREPLYRELHSLVTRTSAGVVLVTHDWIEAALVADRVLVLAGQPASIVAAFDNPRPENINRNATDIAVVEVASRIRETLHMHERH